MIHKDKLINIKEYIHFSFFLTNLTISMENFSDYTPTHANDAFEKTIDRFFGKIKADKIKEVEILEKVTDNARNA